MRIGNLRSRRTDSGGILVEADVDGETLWFASDDAALVASPEAFASALLIPATIKGEPLVVEACLDRSWLESVPAIQRLAKEWWQFPGTGVIAADVIDAARAARRERAMLHGGRGFVSRPHPCQDAARGARTRARIRIPIEESAPSQSLPSAFSRNRRSVRREGGTDYHQPAAPQRRVFGTSWEQGHGGALAALGHLLSEEVERLVIPSSFPYHDSKPWGSHWELDHLWSSRRLAVEHADATLRRDGKVRAIVNQKPVLRHLQVCSETRKAGPPGNCSKCEKCVRTMIALAMCGRLADCDVFDLRRPIEKRVDDLPIVKAHLVSIYEELLAGIDDPRLRAAVKRLISHSQGRPKWWYRRVRRWRQRAHGRLNDGPTAKRVRRRLQTIAKGTPAPLRGFVKRALFPNDLVRWLYPNTR